MFEFANGITDFWNDLSTMHKALAGVVLLVLLYYVYGWYQNRNAAVMMAAGHDQGMKENYSGEADLVCTMYYTNWCKFCKKAKPEWAQLEQEFNGKVVNGKKIMIVKVDCEKDPEIAEQENIKGYPTFKFNMKGKYYDYPDEPVFQKFKTFIEYLVGLRE